MKHIILDNNGIDAALRSKEIRAAIPSVAAAANAKAPNATKKGCGSCGGRNKPDKDYQAIRRALANLSPDDKDRLKSLLGADSISIHLSVDGKSRMETF